MGMLNIYSDASVWQSRKSASIGIFVIDDDENEYGGNKKFTFEKLISEFNTPQENIGPVTVELYALLKSLNLLLDTNADAIIYTDSLTAFELVHDLAKSKRMYALQSALVELCKQNLMKLHKTEIRWIKGHINIYGNSIADKLAGEKCLKNKDNLISILI